MKRIATITDEKGRVTGLVHGPDLVNQSVRALGKIWRFDFDKWCGPLWLNKDGSDRKNQDPPKAVWDAFQNWHDARFKKSKRKAQTLIDICNPDAGKV